MSNNLFSLPTACATPAKLTGVTWDRLDESSLACPPSVEAPEAMVTVSSGESARLACLVTAHPGTRVAWVRSGVKLVWKGERHI